MVFSHLKGLLCVYIGVHLISKSIYQVPAFCKPITIRWTWLPIKKTKASLNITCFHTIILYFPVPFNRVFHNVKSLNYVLKNCALSSMLYWYRSGEYRNSINCILVVQFNDSKLRCAEDQSAIQKCGAKNYRYIRNQFYWHELPTIF